MLPEPALTREDTALIQDFASAHGLTTRTIVCLAMQSLARELRTHGTLTFPLQTGLPSPHCHQCQVSRPPRHHTQPDPEAQQPASNVHIGPWS